MLLDANSKTPLADAIKKEVMTGRRNYNILIVGKTQMRKSTISLTLAREISENFDLERHCAVIYAQKLMDILKNEKFNRGDVVIADDFGIGLNHRKWYTVLNQSLNMVLQTHGFKGIVFILTTPYEKYIDSDTKLLFDMLITVLKKNDKERWAEVKVEELQHTRVGEKIKTYSHFPRTNINGRIARVERIRIKYPDNEILKKYFEYANAEKTRLQADVTSDIKEQEQKKKRINIDYYVEIIEKNKDKFFKIWGSRKFIDLNVVMNEFDVGRMNAARIKAAAEKKLLVE